MIMKVLGKLANEPTWFQLLSHVCSFYGVGAVKAGNMMIDNWGLTLSTLRYLTFYNVLHIILWEYGYRSPIDSMVASYIYLWL